MITGWAEKMKDEPMTSCGTQSTEVLKKKSWGHNKQTFGLANMKGAFNGQSRNNMSKKIKYVRIGCSPNIDYPLI